MAKKIGVLDVHQCATGHPQTYVRKTVAQLLVRRLLAEWVVENVVIRRRAIRSNEQIAKDYQAQIPEWLKTQAVYEHHIEPKFERLPEIDRLLAEQYCEDAYNRLFWAQ